MHQLHNTLLGEFCQRIEIARSISVAESFNGYCCLSVCLYECRSFSILKQHTNVRIHLSMWISLSVRPSGLFKKAHYSVQLWFG